MTTEKVTHHGYHRFYEPLVRDLIQRPTAHPPAMIEIGVYNGDSIPFWRSLAPDWRYVGLDLSPPEIEDPHVQCERLDQSCAEQLDAFVTRMQGHSAVMLVNDDGSHVPDHQVLTFNKLFPLLEPGGMYIVEDIETSYWTRGSLYDAYTLQFGFRHPLSAIERFKQIVDVVNFEFLHESNRAALKTLCTSLGFEWSVLQTVRRISFGPNFIVLEKTIPADDDAFRNRSYRLGSCL